MTEVTVRRDAWFGDREVRLAFPDGWDVTVYPQRGAPEMTDAAIREAVAKPFGSRPLREVAKGKKSVAIIVDDLSRPTPAWRIIPFVLEELRAVGVPDAAIRFVVGGGAHRPLTPDEKARKVGPAVAAKYQVLDHDAYSGNLCPMGNLPDGTPVYINEVVAQAELKLAVSGIYPHSMVGLGGGAKIVVPGVAGIATIRYNHDLFLHRGRGVIENSVPETADVRDNMEAVARHIGLDMVFNTVLNGDRKVAGLFVGDVVAAQRAGARFGQRVYETVLPKAVVESTDIAFINAYPQDMDPVQVSKSDWPWEVFKSAYKVMVNSACDGILYHGVSDKMDFKRWLATKDRRPKVAVPRSAAVTSREQFIMLSEHGLAEDFYRHSPDGALFKTWDATVAALKRTCPKAKVAVIPTAPIQIPKMV